MARLIGVPPREVARHEGLAAQEVDLHAWGTIGIPLWFGAKLPPIVHAEHGDLDGHEGEPHERTGGDEHQDREPDEADGEHGRLHFAGLHLLAAGYGLDGVHVQVESNER